MATELRDIPISACRLSADAIEVGESTANKTPVRLLARSAEPVMSYYYGPIHHDFEGMQAELPLPLDYCHYDEEVIGAAEKVSVDKEGLKAEGFLVSLAAGDRADEVVQKRKAGIPYQASIYLEPLTMEEVLAGGAAKVNGKNIQGPALIIRQWKLRGIAVCPYGRDANTSFDVALSRKLPSTFRVPVTQSNQPTMPPTNPNTTETKPAEQVPAANSAATPATGATQPAKDPSAEARDAFKATLAKFAEKFGAANGAAWAAEGLSYEQALEKHAATLSTQLTSEQGKTKELETKLASVPRGETEPVSFSTNEKHPAGGGTPAAPGKFAHMGNVGKFAASVAEKLPKK